MPSLSAPQDRNNGELPESTLRGPFAGIQSEVSSTRISEMQGFSDALNFMFRLGRIRVRPKFYTDNAIIPPMPGSLEPWMGISDFFNINGVRQQVGITPTRVFYYNSGAWTPLTGVLTGSASDKFSFATVGQQLCFCQGVDKVQLWDGVGATFADASASAVPAKYMMELDNHLIVANTIEAGFPAYQRWRYTGAGDPTDWVSFNAGQRDLFNDLGPINNCLKLYQSGYFFQQLGITQVNITGIGTNPFTATPLSAKSKGLLAPWSLAANGDTIASYVGTDNIYSFDGTTSQSIGDYPMQNRVRGGARSRIFADLQVGSLQEVFGFVSISINGNNYNAYWLVIPGIAIWVFNYDDVTWTRWSIAKLVNYINLWTPNAIIRIADLIGTIAQQTWSPASLVANNAFDAVMIGFADGSSALFDFTGWSEQAASFETGQMSYGDDRHESATKKLRLVYKDNGATTIQVSLTNEEGQVSLNTGANPLGVPIKGTGSGKTLQEVIPVNLPGEYVTAKISVAPSATLEVSDLGFQYSEGGEVRGNGV